MKTADRWKSNPYTNEDGDRGYNEYVKKDFSSESSLRGFEEYILASPHILNRITGIINHDFRKNVFFLETKSHEFERNDDYLIRCTGDYSNNAIVISLNEKELYSKYKKTCRSWAQARKYIIDLINILEDMKKEEGDNLMNKNVKVAKELIKLAKSLVANNIDEQDKVWLDEVEKRGDKYVLHHKVHGLWRIQACKDFGDVKKGDWGGLIESGKNLSHEGNCWVYYGAKVFDNAQVYGNACVLGDANVYDNAKVYNNAKISGYAQVSGNAKIYGKAQVYENAWVHDDAQVYGKAKVFGKAQVYCDAKVDYDVKDEEIVE